MIPLVAAAVAIFLAALAACASSGWHAPSAAAIVALYMAALVSGIALTRVRAVRKAKPWSYHDVVITRAAGVQTLVFASVAALVEAGVLSVLLVMILNEWTSLEVASTVGSVWIAGVVFHPLSFHALLEANVEVGLDAITLERVGRADRFVWLCDLTSAAASESVLVLRHRDGTVLLVPLADSATAKHLANVVTERIEDVDIPPELGRAERTLSEWRATLGSASYRTRALTVDEAERILRSGRAKRDERIGAALVLADLGATDRILRAKASFTQPAMRSSLEKICDGTFDDSWVVWTERRL